MKSVERNKSSYALLIASAHVIQICRVMVFELHGQKYKISSWTQNVCINLLTLSSLYMYRLTSNPIRTTECVLAAGCMDGYI